MKKEISTKYTDFRNGKIYCEVLDYVIAGEAVKATKYMAPNHIIRASRKTYKGKFGRGNIEIVLTIGKPNFLEKEFIKKCKKVGEPFPIKKIQLKLYK